VTEEVKCKFCTDNPDHPMKIVAGYDDPHRGCAYNLWQCEYCGAICKQSIWENPGLTWLNTEQDVWPWLKETTWIT
jgi:hypothetical protein